MASRIQRVFSELKQQGRKGLVPYITAGDPSPAATVGLMHALVRGGADVIELGVPFSDPMADGPTIQLACERALAHGTGLWDVIDMVAEFRRDDQQTPVVLMGYLNPIETRGIDAFAERAQAAGVDGVLIVDLAVEEADEYLPPLRARGLDCIFLLAPTSSDARIETIARHASGYLYYVSLKGVTGAASLDIVSVTEKLEQIRRHSTLPLAVGFGIRDAASARAVGAVADAVVVGSALVSEIERLQHNAEQLPQVLQDRLTELRAALDQPVV
ncbi:tryptophan synthase subunit alpha [Sinimarinibacterium sp. CAU 1509]|uniref:tryptophan synthase subunit alpha n=1 Tax=Sinimarinibacterium sp. CAU 1509 TaxID=2562283 RepID=UPI0010ACF4D3|nr:tryptophan synthase subunit alpha [Sinimarinibacterium sp. CAU 1509]TJY62244.1 tryptophan synthase subunit alpha [Sinimarinibacterium sp. CAU 1509]